MKSSDLGIKKFTKDCPHKSVGLDISPKIIQNYDFAYDTDTRDLKVVEADKEDREAYIQSFASETGVYNIMKMYAKTGDVSLLNRKQGFYGDISQLPEDELNPAQYEAAAVQATGKLGEALGIEGLTPEMLANMSEEEIAAAIDKVVKAKTEAVEKKEGAE